MNESVAFSAAMTPPDIGASTYNIPCSIELLLKSFEAIGEIVLVSQITVSALGF